jgi:hypothetical protein
MSWTSGISLARILSRTSFLKLNDSVGKDNTLTTSLSLKGLQPMTTSMTICFLARALTLSIFLRCLHMAQLAELAWFAKCNQGGILRMNGSCLTMLSE